MESSSTASAKNLPEPPPPTARRRRLLAVLLLAGATLLAAEILSYLALGWSHGTPRPCRALQAERSRLLAAAAERRQEAADRERRQAAELATDAGAAPLDNAFGLLADPAHRRRVLHPYLGYVYDPLANEQASRRAAGYPAITPEGFYGPGPEEGAVRRPASQPPVTVAVFGGSLAMLFAVEGGEALVRQLAASPALAGRPVTLESYALGGYKQPQQLLALAYLLSLGRRPDLAINLDGLNEIALPVLENRPRGVFPFFPRSWDALVEEAVNPAALAEAGLVTYLEGRRAALARRFSRAPQRYLASANLLWAAQDRALAVEIARGHERLARLPSSATGDSRFAATGPAFSAPEGDLEGELAEEWRRSSLAMARLAAAHGIRYYHFLQPNQYDSGAKPLSRAEAAVAIAPGSPFGEAVRRGYPRLARAGEALRQAGVRFFDLRRVFADVEEPLYIDTCCHVGRAGNLRLAAAIGAAIRRDLDRDLDGRPAVVPRPASAPPPGRRAGS